MRETYLPENVCSLCKGKCCREMGCALCPEDLFRLLETDAVTEAGLLALLRAEDSYISIDSFSDRGRVFYVRMRHKCYTYIGVDAIGECVALTENGCGFSDELRPFGGRALKPSEDMHCTQGYTREMMKKDWEPYQTILSKIYIEHEKILEENGTFDRCDEEYYRWLREKGR